MKIVVLGGGNSTEREISLQSAEAVAKALGQAGYDVVQLDTKNGFSQLDELAVGTIVFPILHGQGGEDGVIQTELEKRNLFYLGTKSEASAVCFDKWLTLEKLEKADIPIAKGALVSRENYKSHELAKAPHVLKVARGGSSIGTYIVRDPNDIDDQKIQEVFDLDDKAVIEELIEGVEITVPVLDKTALPVIEIRPPENKEFDYEHKYDGSTQELCPPESVDETIQVKAQRLSEQVHKVLEARHLSRIDMMVRNNGDLVVLELNTMPGMTDKSLYPKSARVDGMTMVDLVKSFVDLVSKDYNENYE